MGDGPILLVEDDDAIRFARPQMTASLSE